MIDTPDTSSTEQTRKLAKDVAPDPLEGLTTEAPEGIAANLATYHAARAQGFYLATMEETGSIREFVSPLLYEATLAGIYFDLATTDEVAGDTIAFNNAAAMRNPEGIGPFIYRLLEWSNIDPDSVKAYTREKPRTITTLEELKALPFGSIIRGQRHYQVACFEDDSEHGWAISGNRGARQASDFESWLPVTVIAEGVA